MILHAFVVAFLLDGSLHEFQADHDFEEWSACFRAANHIEPHVRLTIEAAGGEILEIAVICRRAGGQQT